MKHDPVLVTSGVGIVSSGEPGGLTVGPSDEGAPPPSAMAVKTLSLAMSAPRARTEDSIKLDIKSLACLPAALAAHGYVIGLSTKSDSPVKADARVASVGGLYWMYPGWVYVEMVARVFGSTNSKLVSV